MTHCGRCFEHSAASIAALDVFDPLRMTTPHTLHRITPGPRQQSQGLGMSLDSQTGCDIKDILVSFSKATIGRQLRRILDQKLIIKYGSGPKTQYGLS